MRGMPILRHNTHRPQPTHDLKMPYKFDYVNKPFNNWRDKKTTDLIGMRVYFPWEYKQLTHHGCDYYGEHVRMSGARMSGRDN